MNSVSFYRALWEEGDVEEVTPPQLRVVTGVDFSKKLVKSECRCQKSFLKSHEATKAELLCGTPQRQDPKKGTGDIKADVSAYKCAGWFHVKLTQAKVS